MTTTKIKKKQWTQEDNDKTLNEINDAKLNPGKTNIICVVNII